MVKKMWTVFEQWLRSFFIFVHKIWNFIVYFCKKTSRKVKSHNWQCLCQYLWYDMTDIWHPNTRWLLILISDIVWNLFFYFFQVIQHQTIKYDSVPLSPLSRHRLNLVKRKVMVLDLDETLIHSNHDGVQRYAKIKWRHTFTTVIACVMSKFLPQANCKAWDTARLYT